MLAGDLVWITPETMHHFLSEGAVLDFLRRQISADTQARYVDIASMKSSPSAENVVTVAYEVNLVSREDERPLHLRCSMAICRRGKRLEITFLHFSKRAERDSSEQLRDFVTNLPCGVMILACLDGQREEALFYNEYFAHRLRYRQEEFARAMAKNPFFMASEEDRDRIQEEIDRARKSGGSISANLRFYRRDGNSFYYRMTGAPAYQADGGTVYYCVFQETTGFRLAADRLQGRLDGATEILQQIPEGICGIEYPAEARPGTGNRGLEPRVFFVSKNIPGMFGVSNSTYMNQILLDPLFGLEMTGITRSRILKTGIFNPGQAGAAGPVSLGIFRLKKEGLPEKESADRQADRIELVVRRICGKDRTVRLYLFYYNREEQQREQESRVDRAMKMGRAGQDRLRAELQRAREAAASLKSEHSAAMRAAEEKHEAQVSRLEDQRLEEKNRAVLLSRRLEESRAAQRQMAEKLERAETDAARRIRNCEARADRKVQLAQEEQRDRETRAEEKVREAFERLRRTEEEAKQKADLAQREVRKAEAARSLAEEQLREAQERARVLEQELRKERAHRQLLEEQRERGSVAPFPPAQFAPNEQDLPAGIGEAKRMPPLPVPQGIGRGLAAGGAAASADWMARTDSVTVFSAMDPAGDVRPNAAGRAVPGSSPLHAQAPLREKAFSPEKCLLDVLSRAEVLCAEKEITLRDCRDSGLPSSVTGFGDLLVRALCELVENAVGHTRRGGAISVHSWADRPSGGFVNLYFRIDCDGAEQDRLRTGSRDWTSAQRPGLEEKTGLEEGFRYKEEKTGLQESFRYKEEKTELQKGFRQGDGQEREPDGISAAREAATLMGGSVDTCHNAGGFRWSLTVTLRV